MFTCVHGCVCVCVYDCVCLCECLRVRTIVCVCVCGLSELSCELRGMWFPASCRAGRVVWQLPVRIDDSCSCVTLLSPSLSPSLSLSLSLYPSFSVSIYCACTSPLFSSSL